MNILNKKIKIHFKECVKNLEQSSWPKSITM